MGDRVKIKHGDRVVVFATLERITTHRQAPRSAVPRLTTWKVWNRSDVAMAPGLFLGWRALRDGTRHWEDEAGSVFTPEGQTIRAALVSIDPRRNPVYVPCDALYLVGVSDTEAVALIASEIGDAIAAHQPGESLDSTARARQVWAAIRGNDHA